MMAFRKFLKSSQIAVLLYYIMKTAKSYGKVAKPSFFDRVRNYSQKDLDHKQKFDINHIRQSNYKLERSKSHRTQHSLQRKAPIVIQQLKMSKSKQHLQKRTLQTEFSQDLKESTYKIKFDDCLRQNKENECKANIEYAAKDQNLQNKRKKYGKDLSFNEVLSLLKTSLSKKQQTENKEQIKQVNYLTLQQQEECLNLIKLVWQGINLMKSKMILCDQALKMEELLKLQVIKLAKPKLQILQQGSAVSLKIFPFGTGSVQKMTSSKEENDKSVANFNIGAQEMQESSYDNIMKNLVSNTSEYESKEELEYKKIMYILEESKKNKLVDMIQQSRQQKIENQSRFVQEQGLDQSIQRKPKIKKHHSSSFNSMRTASDRSIVYQQEKTNNSYSNDKLFLKNIVKKAKRVEIPHSQAKSASYVKKNMLDNMNIKAMSSVQSEIRESITQQLQDQFDESYEESKSEEIDNCLSALNSKYPNDSKITSQAESVKSDGESKRATLNNIINMLNQRYNKHIRLEPLK